MLRRGSLTASSAKRKTHSCTEVTATQLAEGWTKTQWLKGYSYLLSMVDGFEKVHESSCTATVMSFLHHGIHSRMDPHTRWSHREKRLRHTHASPNVPHSPAAFRACMSSPHHQRKLPETLVKKNKSVWTKVHTTPAAQKHRENTASLKLGIVQVNI